MHVYHGIEGKQSHTFPQSTDISLQLKLSIYTRPAHTYLAEVTSSLNDHTPCVKGIYNTPHIAENNLETHLKLQRNIRRKS